jgi:hypothetical protein
MTPAALRWNGVSKVSLCLLAMFLLCWRLPKPVQQAARPRFRISQLPIIFKVGDDAREDD